MIAVGAIGTDRGPKFRGTGGRRKRETGLRGALSASFLRGSGRDAVELVDAGGCRPFRTS